MRLPRWPVYMLLAAIVLVVYIGLAASRSVAGYPLDDAWIHQTYARYWAQTGQLTHVVGAPSVGSTAPLWNGLWLFLFIVAMVGRIGLPTWREPLSTPWGSLLGVLAASFRTWGTRDVVSLVVDVFMMVFLIYATILTARLTQRSYFVYAATTLLMNLMITSAHVPLLDVLGRVLSAFPIFSVVALYLLQRVRRWLVIPVVPTQMLLSATYVKWVLIG